MRIISGKYKGKKLKGYDIEGTRPTMDRVKESIYGIIQRYVKDSTVLDLFAGSGSLGLEAISNGAKKLILVDNNKKVTDVIKENIKSFDDNIEVITIDYKKYLKNTVEKYDIIFLDPPYRAGLLNKALKIIEERNLLNENGIIVCEFENIKIETNFLLIKEKKYGPKTVYILKKNN
ncbi:MAG: 16S rRNA (guanine(966)-N(2))-methyltransferase RsmD [Bacilli bacterium]|nr:16S rRNA (guanine(966)-N(2))-methyltransferase RsmD [Bacilli bacterium]